MTNTADTITLPTQRVRADGIAPLTTSGERAIFSHPGPITNLQSGRWVAAIDVVLAKLIAVVVDFHEPCTLTLMENGDVVAALDIEGFTQQMPLPPVELTAEIDQLWVQVTATPGAVDDLTVFVSFR